MSSFLIIDDSPDDREHQAAMLVAAGPDVHVVACHGSKDGLIEVRAQAFDCVVLDLRLDGEDGLNVLRQVHDIRPTLPVIVLTGEGSEQTATDAFVAGAAYYLPKNGLTADTLWTAVSRVIESAKRNEELKVKREALERSNRLDAVGQLAAGIAHDFNNQLASLRFCIQLLSDAAATSKQKQHVQTAIKVIDHSAALATRLVSLSRQADLLATNVLLNETLADLAALAAASTPSKIVLEVHQPEEAIHVFCDAGQLLNALLNLVLNANEATTSGGEFGTVSVITSCNADHVRISVKDTGIGMSEAVLAKCIDPFFTTKENTNGTGLGLAMVQSFVNDHGGILEVASEDGVGSEITVVLLLAHDVAASVDGLGPANVPFENANILLVDDNLSLSWLVKEVLEVGGHTVELANTGEQALGYLTAGGQPDLLLTDVSMPGMSGIELASKVVAIRPDIRVIYWTGQADDPDHSGQPLHGPVLQKPVEPDLLLSEVNKALQ